MAMTPEKRVKSRVVEVLKAHNVYYFFPATFGMGRSGVPDIICCFHGYFIAIECKAGGNTPTALQEREHRLIRSAGGDMLVINEDNIDEVAFTLKTIKERECIA